MIALLETLLGSRVGRYIAEALLILALLASAVLYLEHRGAATEVAKLQKSSAALIAKANADIRAQESAHAAENAANQEKYHAALAANIRLESELADSVRNFDSYRRSHANVPRAAGGSGAAPSGECGTESCGDLASELAVRGNALAGSVGELSASLQACQRDRDSLTGLPR